MVNAPVINSFARATKALGAITDPNAWELSGTAVANGVVSVFDGNSLLGSVQADATGVWTIVADLPAGNAISFTATATDQSGNTSGASAPFIANTDSTVAIVDGAHAEIDGASTQSVIFTGATGSLKLGDSLGFTGSVTGLAGADALDLSDVKFGANTQVNFLGDSLGGTLTVTDGNSTANISLKGNYLASGWTLSSDGQGGTIVVDPGPSETWQPMKIGAGGWLTGIDIAPDGTAVVRTDTYGAYIWNGTQWQQLVTSTSMPTDFVAPHNNQGVYEIQVAPNNSSILYMMYEGYVFRSDDKGVSWTQTAFAKVTEDPNDPYRMNGQKMAVDPNNPNVVYVGTPQNGLFVTTDGGASWSSVSGIPASLEDSNGLYPGITGIEFDPTSGVTGGATKTIYASSYGNGVYESTDGGISWSALSGGPRDVEYAAVSSTGVYYAVGNNNTSLWRFINGAWTQVLSNAAVGGNGIHTVSIDPFNPNHVLIITPGGNINQSLDGGATWSGIDWNSKLSATDVPWLANSGLYMSIGGAAFDPLVQGKLWTSAGVGVWNTELPQKPNGPIVWNSQSAGIEQLIANEIIVPPGGKPVVASWDRSFFYVGDPNSYATSYGVAGQKAFAAGWSVDYASSNPSFLVGIADWFGTEQSGYSKDGGQTWQVFANEPPFAGKTIGGTIAASSPTDIVWAPADGVAPYYTQDGGVTWNPVVLPGVSDWSNFDFAYYLDKQTVTADRVLPNTFYMYYVGSAPSSDGVYKSTDGGATWSEVFSGQISANSNFNSKIASVPGEAGNLFFTGGPLSGPQPAHEGFFASKDGGATWNAVPNVLEVSCFGFGKSATAGGYPAIYIVGYVNNVYGIWQSNDDAQSWTQIGQYPTGSLDTIKTISGDPNTYGQVYVGFGGSGYASLSATSPVTVVTPSSSNADLNAGKTITLTLNLSTPLTVTGGIPSLLLNNGGLAKYTGGSGTNALTFSYTVATGQNTSDLAVTAVSLNSATVTDAAGNPANLSGAVTNPAGTLQIDTTVPTVSSLTDTPVSGLLGNGKVVTLTVRLSEAVTVAGGIPSLSLNDGGTATYTGGTGTNTLVFSYTVSSGQVTPDLAVTGFKLNSATVTDAAGNAADLSGAIGNPDGTLQIDATAPTVSGVISNPSNGDLNAGKLITLTIKLTEAVKVIGGTPTLALNDGGMAHYVGGSGTNELTFNYQVAAGQNIGDLAITGINLNAATVMDTAGNAAHLDGAIINPAGSLQIDTLAPTVKSVVADPPSGALTSGKVITLTAQLSETVTIAGGMPTLALNDGGFATYKSGSGTNSLTFTYTIGAGDRPVSVLAITGVNLPSGTMIADGAGNAANLSGILTTLTGLQINNPATTSLSIAVSNLSVTPGKSIAASALFVPTIPVGDQIIKYDFQDAGTGGGHFVLNGVVQASNQEIVVTAAQLPQLTYQSGSGTDTLSVRISDGAQWSPWSKNFTVSSLVDTGPIITPANPNMSVKQGQVFSASSLFTYHDAAGYAAVKYDIWDSGVGGGHFVLDGVALGTHLENILTPAQVARLTYVSGSFGTDNVMIRVGDGGPWSAWTTFTISEPSIIANGATMEPTSAFSGTVLFAGATGTLKIDKGGGFFSGKIAGQLAIGDVIDLTNITAGSKATLSYTGNNSPGTLTVSDGTHTDYIALLGNYSLANFTASSDGHGGTNVVDPPLTTSATVSSPGALLDKDPIGGMALWAQHLASTFPDSAFSSQRTWAAEGAEEQGGHLANLPSPGAIHQHG